MRPHSMEFTRHCGVRQLMPPPLLCHVKILPPLNNFLLLYIGLVIAQQMYVISGLCRYDVQYFVETGNFGDVVLNNSYKELAMEIQLNVKKWCPPQHISGVVAISSCCGSHDSLASRALQMLQS